MFTNRILNKMSSD